jgi:hypothetical protein
MIWNDTIYDTIYDMKRYDTIKFYMMYDMKQYDIWYDLWYETVRYDKIWYDMIYDMKRYDMTRFDMICVTSLLTFLLGVTTSLRLSGTTRGPFSGITQECLKVRMTTRH